MTVSDTRPIVPDTDGEIDFGRLARALELDCRRVGKGQYFVAGGQQGHWVDLHTARVPRCDCGDHLWRERLCKHILAALLREGNEDVLRAVRILFRGVLAQAA